MKTLPDHVQQYSASPIFTEKTIPAGLLKDHNTKNGVSDENLMALLR